MSAPSHGGKGEPPGIGDIDLLLFDFDGVLTDNRVTISSDGIESVVCNRADGWGLDLLRPAGLKMAIVSTETSPVVRVRAEKLKLPVLQGVKDKGEAVRRYAMEQGVALARTGFVGNDTNDLPALEIVGWPMCPTDAAPEVLAMARWIVGAKGGAGVVRSLAGTLLHPEQSPGVAPAADHPYTTISRRVVFAAEPYVKVTRERLRARDGREIDDYYLIEQPDYAVVVATTPAGEILFVREYKHGAGRYILALPGGNVDPGEDALEAAQRELREETGYAASGWRRAGQFVCHGSQGCGNAHIFLATDAVPAGGLDSADVEHRSVELLSPARARDALAAGEIAVIGHATALALFLAEKTGG